MSEYSQFVSINIKHAHCTWHATLRNRFTMANYTVYAQCFFARTLFKRMKIYPLLSGYFTIQIIMSSTTHPSIQIGAPS